jgi:hypothetical protein
MEDPDMNSYLIFYKDAQNIWWSKHSLFTKCCYENWIPACRKLKVDLCLNIRPEILQLVQDRAGNTLETIVIVKDFLSRTPAAQQQRERIEK